jgi:hypothetical protein
LNLIQINTKKIGKGIVPFGPPLASPANTGWQPKKRQESAPMAAPMPGWWRPIDGDLPVLKRLREGPRAPPWSGEPI